MKQLTRRMLCGIPFLAASALLLSCASAPPPEGMATSAATIRAAQEVGAADVPRAALHIQLAREQAEHARVLVEKGGRDERVEADFLLMRAQADANLALALAREDTERAEAEQALANVRSIHTGK
jgi:hypothetical protein